MRQLRRHHGVLAGASVPAARAAAALAFGTELEGLFERLCLTAKLAGDGAVFGIGRDERLGLARFGALVHVEHGVVDDFITLRPDDHGLLAAVARRPDAALLARRCGRRGRFGGPSRGGRLQRLVGVAALLGFAGCGELCREWAGWPATCDVSTAAIVGCRGSARRRILAALPARLIEETEWRGARRRRGWVRRGLPAQGETLLLVFGLAGFDRALRQFSADRAFGPRIGGFGLAAALVFARFLHQLGFGVRPCAKVLEPLGDAPDHAAVGAGAGCPLGGQVAESHGARETLVPIRQYAPLLDLARAIGHRIVDAFAGVEQEMLQMRAHPRGDVLETLAAFAAAGGAEAGEIVLLQLHIPGAVTVAEAQRARLEQHLVEGIVPAHAQRFADAHVFAGDAAEAWVELGVAAFQVGEEATGGDAGRHGVVAGGLDRRQVGGSERNWRSKQGKKEKRSDAALHGTPT